jgi:hypothetical protein
MHQGTAARLNPLGEVSWVEVSHGEPGGKYFRESPFVLQEHDAMPGLRAVLMAFQNWNRVMVPDLAGKDYLQPAPSSRDKRRAGN